MTQPTNKRLVTEESLSSGPASNILNAAVETLATDTGGTIVGFNDARYAQFSDLSQPPTFQMPKASLTYLTQFQSGHGFTVSGSGASLADDTSDYRLGNQSVKVTTGGTGANAFLDKYAGTAMDLSGKEMAVLVKVSDVTKLNYIQLYLGTGSMTAYKALKIAVGDTATIGANRSLRSGEWMWLYFSWGDVVTTVGTPNLAAITDIRFLTLDRNSGAVNVNYGGFATFLKDPAYPNGVVSFTFDDLYASHYTIARPILDAAGYAGTMFPIVDRVGTAGNLTLDQIKALCDVNGWDIGGHSFTSANHAAGYTALTDAQIDADLYNMKQWLTNNGFRGSDFWAWPLGDDSAALQTKVAKYFTYARHTYLRPGGSPMPLDNPMRVPAFQPAYQSVASIQAAIDSAYDNGTWVNILSHNIAASPAAGEVSTANFQALVTYCQTKGIPVQPVSQVLRNIA